MTLENACFRSKRACLQHAAGVVLCLALAHGTAQADDGGAMRDASLAGMDASSTPDGGTDGGNGNTGGDTGGATSGSDATTGSEPQESTAACSCETDDGSGEREIHLCTGSFESEICRDFRDDPRWCEDGTKLSRRCDDDSPVRLCCKMKARGLYTYLYEDCTHPNCEVGFRAQCDDFAGKVVEGLCDPTSLPDGGDPELGDDPACSVATHGARTRNGPVSALVWMLSLSFVARRKRRG